MKIKQIRSATLVIEYGGVRFLIDPWLAAKDSMPGFPGCANPELRQPTTPLPLPIEEIVDVDAVIVTHVHTDHWDHTAAERIPADMPIFVQHAADKALISQAGSIDLENGMSVRHVEGKTFTEIDAAWPDDAQAWRKRVPDWAPEGGESLLTLRERIAQTAQALAERHMGEQIVLVAHGGVLDVLYRIATGQELQAPRTWQLGNASINRLLWTPQGFSLVGWADTRHLDQDTRDETHT